jgi:hypothetical protein
MTPEQIAYIREHYWELGPTEIAHRLGLGKNQVAGKAYRLGLKHCLPPGQAFAARLRRLPSAREEFARRKRLAWERRTPEERRAIVVRSLMTRTEKAVTAAPQSKPVRNELPAMRTVTSAEIEARRRYLREYAQRLRAAEQAVRGWW